MDIHNNILIILFVIIIIIIPMYSNDPIIDAILLICYDIYSVTLQALQDIRHPTPGLAAIVDFHRSCVDAACLNPNSWTLTRNQISSVLSRKVSWFDIEAKQRLLTSYDHHQTGKIRFVRISTALVCCTRPAMTELMSLLIRGESYSSCILIVEVVHEKY